MGDDFLNHLLSELIVLIQNLSPKVKVSPLNKVDGLLLPESFSVGELNQLIITVTPISLVSSVGKMGILLFTVLTNDLGVKVMVLNEELLRVLMEINVQLGNGVMDGWGLVTFLDPGL